MSWPQALQSVTGPFTAERLDGAIEGMGPYGPMTRSLATDGLVQPDLITGMTLNLLARQARREASRSTESAKSTKSPQPSAIGGGVWVREQFTIHSPLERTDPFVITGESTGRYVRKGRRYSTATSQSHTSDGAVVATNLTTGLVAYKAVEGLADSVEGIPFEETPRPAPDFEAAKANPHLDALRGATAGQSLAGDSPHDVVVSLAMMVARDTSTPDNPIHSDPEAARAAGLKRPIAGGSHVLAFALEQVMAAFGPRCLLHGAFIDARWKAPTHADVAIVARSTVSAVHHDRVEIDYDVTLDDGSTAMLGSVIIPLPL